MIHSRKLESDSPYLTDESKLSGAANMLFVPDDEEDVVEIVISHNSSRTPLTISAMRTGVCGGCVPKEGDIISMEKFNKVIGIGKDDKGYFIRAQAAVTVKDLNEIIRKKLYPELQNITDDATECILSERTDYFYPVDPTELNGSIGGNISTNASGPRTYKYGPTRDWVRRIRIVLSDGNILDVLRGEIKAKNRVFSIPVDGKNITVHIPSYEFNRNVKNTTGLMTGPDMDLVDLFVGSEGMFGIITEADIYITEWHPLMSNIIFFPSDDDAYDFVKEFVNSHIDPEFIEFFDTGSLDLIRKSKKNDPKFTGMPDIPDYAGSAIFFDISNDANIVSKYNELSQIAKIYGGSLDRSWCGHELKDRERFFAFRHSVPQTIFEYVASLKGSMPGMHKMGTDMSVPLDRLDEMIDSYSEVLTSEKLEYVIFGHIGNGHLHVEIILKSMDDLSKAKKAYHTLALRSIELGGSPSAEHGIGKIKSEYIELLYGKQGVEEIKKTKKELDPNWIFCPGNVVE